MTWVDVLMSRPADLSLLLACVNLLILLTNAASGWREVDLSPQACLRQTLELDTRRLRRVDGRFQDRAHKTMTQNRAVFGGCLTK